MNREGVRRIIKVVGLLIAAVVVLLAVQFLLNVTGGGRSDVSGEPATTIRFEGELS